MLRNCLKKGFPSGGRAGCGGSDVFARRMFRCESGWLKGRAFTMNAYSNTGELTLTIDFSPRLKPGDSKL